MRLPLLLGNRVCLDFVNSLDPRKGESRECLHRYTDLTLWGVHASLLGRAEAEALRARADANPAEADAVFRRTTDLRETLYHLLYAVSQGRELPEADAAALRQTYAEALPEGRLVRSGDRFTWVWPGDTLETPLYRLVNDAVDLLRTGEPERLKECANPVTCGWLFYDVSKNNRRRWCTMAECGVADKVRQQRRRRAKTAKD